ncbi:uncharacterized protein LOC134522111 [Chroicocephalus ridibundus]
MGSNILDMVVLDPGYWLTDVPKFMRYIHKNVECICTEPARHSLDSLLLRMTEWCPREVVRSLLKISPTCDSAALAMWEVMISVPWILWSVLTELLSVLQDQRVRKVFSCATEDACIYPLALLLYTDIDAEEFAALYRAQRYLRRPSSVMLSLVLSVLITLSKKPKMATKMQVLLPDIMENLQDANADAKMKALVFLRSMMGDAKTEEASLIAVQLAEKLPPLFDDGSGATQPQLHSGPTAPVFGIRAQSISPHISHANALAHHVMKAVVGINKKKMKKRVQRVLLPLFLHMSDEIESVAQGHPPRLCRVPGVEEAQPPGQDKPDAPDRRVLVSARQEQGRRLSVSEPAVPAQRSGHLARGGCQVHWACRAAPEEPKSDQGVECLQRPLALEERHGALGQLPGSSDRLQTDKTRENTRMEPAVAVLLSRLSHGELKESSGKGP